MFVFPGTGHLYLKKYIPGLLLALCAATATYVIVSNAVEMALEVVEQIQNGSVPLDVGTITELASQQSSAADGSTNIAVIVLFLCWITGILDSYRVGYMLEKVDGVVNENET